MRTPKWTRQCSLDSMEKESDGDGSSIGLGWRSFPMEFRGTINNILPWADWASYLETGGLTMAAKISLKPFIRFICGVEFIRRLTFSTSTILATTAIGVPSWRLP